MREHILPLEKEYLQETHAVNPDWTTWKVDPKVEALKTKAKTMGLWNLFLPDISGLSNLEYASLAEITGYSSSQHLSTQFKQVTGLSPSHFKKIGTEKNKLG